MSYKDVFLLYTFQNRMNDIFQPLDTIQQYLDHITIYRKATGILQQYNTNPT